jgi:hypothetical protein
MFQKAQIATWSGVIREAHIELE